MFTEVTLSSSRSLSAFPVVKKFAGECLSINGIFKKLEKFFCTLKKAVSASFFPGVNIVLTNFRCSVQSLSCVRLFVTPWTETRQASLSISNSRSLLKLMSIESVMPSSHLILCHPLLLRLQSFPASGSFPMSQVFSNESALCIRWPKY